jgi:hypothetical protein
MRTPRVRHLGRIGLIVGHEVDDWNENWSRLRARLRLIDLTNVTMRPTGGDEPQLPANRRRGSMNDRQQFDFVRAGQWTPTSTTISSIRNLETPTDKRASPWSAAK